MYAAVVALVLEVAGCGAGGVRPADLRSRPRPSAPGTAEPTRPAALCTLRFHTSTGTVASYDAGRRVLVLRSAGGESRFLVATEARLWIGTHRARVDRLAASIGVQATVAWAENGGVPTTHTVRLSRARRENER